MLDFLIGSLEVVLEVASLLNSMAFNQQVVEILKRIPEETKRKLAGKGYFPQDGYIIQYLPVPPNCLSVPEVSDGVSVMSSVRQHKEFLS